MKKLAMAINNDAKDRTGSCGLDLAFWSFHTSLSLLCDVKSSDVKAIQIQMICTLYRYIHILHVSN